MKGKNEIKNSVWIHVGDDLAYDIGGSAACGAKTVLMELADKYEQTARKRFESDEQAPWSTILPAELEKHKKMNEDAKQYVDKRISYISGLPEAINDIMDES